MASEEDSRVVAVEGFVAAIVDSEVVVVSAVAVIATVTETAATARQTDSARLLMLLPAQVLVVVLGVIVVTDTALVGMTRAAAVAHMMTDPVDATAADSATGTDAVVPTSSPSASVDQESIATTTVPEKTTAGSVGTRAATKTPESSVATSGPRYQSGPISLLRQRLGGGYLPSSQSVLRLVSFRLSFSPSPPRVSKGKIHNAGRSSSAIPHIRLASHDVTTWTTTG